MGATTRYIKQNASGEWDIVKEGHRRATAYGTTKAGAIARAKALTRREGGGEVLVLNRSGKIVSSKTVERPRRAK